MNCNDTTHVQSIKISLTIFIIIPFRIFCISFQIPNHFNSIKQKKMIIEENELVNLYSADIEFI